MKEKEYEVEIRETLSKVVKVKAENKTEAIDKVEKMHRNEEIVLSGDDYTGYPEFEVLN